MINRERILENFLSYVKIDSESGNEKAMCDRVVADLKALGLEVRTDTAGEKIKAGSNGYNVYATFGGELPGEPLIMCAHLDTVVPGVGIEPVIEDGIIRSKGDTILAADDKSGVAGILEAIKVAQEQKLPCRPIEILFSIFEEGGMHGVKNMEYDWIKGKEAVVFDSSGDVGKIITNGPGQVKIYATVHGRAAHGGIAPEKGISAIQVAAVAVSRMKLLRIDEETTCNIGTFSAVGATNIVAPKVEFVAEVRSRDFDKLNAHVKHIVDCLQQACDEFGATLECDPQTNYVSFRVPDDDPLVKRVFDACDKLGFKAFTTPGGGGSDANVMALHDIKPIVLGTGMKGAHELDEEIAVDDLVKTAQLALQLMID